MPRGNRVFLLVAVVSRHVDLALTLADFTKANHAVDLRDDGRLTRLARFEQFHHARQTAGDVLGARRFLGNLRQHVARSHFVAILNHQVRAARQQVTLVRLRVFDNKRRLALFIGAIGNHPAGEAGDFIHFLVERDAFLKVLELHRAADLGEDRVRVRIPLRQQLAQLDVLAVFHLEARAVNHNVALLLAAAFVLNGERAGTVHRHQRPVLAFDRAQVDEAHEAVVLGVEARLVLHAAGRAAHVEGTHGQLRARLADGLRRNHAAGLAQLNHAAGAEVAPVAERADAAPGFAGKHGADLHPLHARTLNGRCDVFVDSLVHVDNNVAVVILDALERHAANDAVAQRLDDFAGLDDRADINSPRPYRNRTQ